jgi:hypothetical protein
VREREMQVSIAFSQVIFVDSEKRTTGKHRALAHRLLLRRAVRRGLVYVSPAVGREKLLISRAHGRVTWQSHREGCRHPNASGTLDAAVDARL